MTQIAHAPARGIDWVPGDPTDNRTEELHRIGALQGLVIAAEGNGLQHDAEAAMARQQARGNLVDYAVGLVPGVGDLNDLAELADTSVGGFAYPSGFERLHEAETIQSLRATDMNRANIVMLAVLEHPDAVAALPPRSIAAWAERHYNDDDRDAITAASGDAVRLFLAG
jgi:hypothetical protein